MEGIDVCADKIVEKYTDVVNWLDLPLGIPPLIANKLINIKDYIRFGVVCRSWQSVYIENLRQYCPPPQLPFLMLTTKQDNDEEDDNQTPSFYSLSERQLCNIRVTLPHNMVCRGSSHGWLWLVMVDQNYRDVRLFNPFLVLNNEIKLPEFKLDTTCLYKVVLSANPASNANCVVMAVYGGCSRLAFFMPGDTTWTCDISLDGYHLSDNDCVFENVIWYKDLLYVVTLGGTLFACDVYRPQPQLSQVAPSPKARFPSMRIYLVESSGDLLQVRRRLDSKGSTYFTAEFEIFKLDSMAFKWDEVKSLCGRALFLGDNSSICLSPSDFPGCKPNCIYFTDDYFEVHDVAGPDVFYDTGVFSLEDGSIERHCPIQTNMKFPPPIWIEPTLQGHFG